MVKFIETSQTIDVSSTLPPTPDEDFDTGVVTLQLNPALTIPRNAKNVEVSVQAATIWWSIPNVVVGKNKITVSGPYANSPYVLTIPTGLYSLAQLSTAIAQQMTNAGAPATIGGDDFGPIIELLADNATQKVIIRTNYVGTTVDMTMLDSIAPIIGFEFVTVGPSTIAGEGFFAPNTAALAPLQFFQIRSSLVNDGIRTNNSFDSIIAIVLIEGTSPGSQLVFSPRNPQHTAAPHLKGARLTRIKVELTDELGNRVFVPNEIFSALIKISYHLPIEDL